MDCKLSFDGFELGGTSDSVSKLRLLDADRLVGFGTPPVTQVSTDRLAGGTHLGRPHLGARTITAAGLLASDWVVARNFAAAMTPDTQLHPLVYQGPAYPAPVRAYVSPQGVAVPLDALGQSLEKIRLTGASWIAPDPTLYSDTATTRTITASTSNFQTATWTNPGVGAPPAGIGGHAWTLETTVKTGIVTALTIIAAEQIDGQWVDMPWVRIPVLAPAGTVIRVGADRIPTGAMGSDNPAPLVAESQTGGVWVPDPIWPRFRGGVPSRIGVTPTGTQSPTIETTVTLRGTWL